MARRKPWEVSDELWAVIEPLLPKHERWVRYPGRKRIDDRKTLQGVLFVLYTGVQWEFLPQELGLMTRRTPVRPRSRNERRNSVQNASVSLSPTMTPRTSRPPSSVTPVAMTTAWETI
jgi:transposase